MVFSSESWPKSRRAKKREADVFRIVLGTAVFLISASCSSKSADGDQRVLPSSSSAGGSAVSKGPQSSDQTPADSAVSPVEEPEAPGNEELSDTEEENGNDQLGLTYTGEIKPLVDSSCVGCHSAELNPERTPLETYSQVSQAVDQMIAAILSETNPMPPGQAAADRRDLADIIQAWKDEGLQENPLEE